VDVKPRKSPRQARAKATVEAIIEATIQVLLKEGYDRLTTARVAERAGVSVGSLYQYYPNKAALGSAVVERCCADFLTAFEETLARRRGDTLAACVASIVEATMVSHRLTPELHGIVRDLAPRVGVADKAQAVSQAAVRAIETMLRAHANEIAPGFDIAIAATVIETVLEALAHRAVSEHPARLQGKRLAREAARLVTNYLAVTPRPAEL
jgi:AcrR family transcriptional regulator